MTAILGLSAFYHDSAAALVVDGEVVAASQEERFSRHKHDARFPRLAIADCLRIGGLEPSDVDHVVFYDKPLLKFDRYLETVLARAPGGLPAFLREMPGWLRERLHVSAAVRRHLRGYRGRIAYTEHHESHAASAFYPSPFDSAAVLTLDGVGEWATATVGVGRRNRIELRSELRFPHSPGLLYSAFTSFCGFRVNDGEYKLMGLAPYGEPRFAEIILEKIVDLRDDGSFRLDQTYFDYCGGRRMTSSRFAGLFGGPARSPESEITQREMDLAASVQCVVEEIVLRMARHIRATTGESRLCWRAAWPSTASPTAGCCGRDRSTTSGFNPLRAMREAHWGPPCSPGINCSTGREVRTGTTGNPVPFSGPSSGRTRFVVPSLRPDSFIGTNRTSRSCARTLQNCSPTETRLAGCRDDWSTARGLSERGAFSRTLVTRGCSLA